MLQDNQKDLGIQGVLLGAGEHRGTIGQVKKMHFETQMQETGAQWGSEHQHPSSLT